jgi:ribosomal-protein-alanine N-acetyltransferase
MPGPVFLEGETVTLRPVEEEDIGFIQRCMNDPQVWRPALDINPTNREQSTEFFETVISGSDGVHCLACDDETPLGIVSLTGSQYGPDETSRARAAELAYWFAPEHHGQGYGSDAATQMVRYAFEDRNLRRVSASVGSFNDSSIGLLESLGFEHEGTLREAAWFRGEYHDMLVYGLLREDWRARE